MLTMRLKDYAYAHIHELGSYQLLAAHRRGILTKRKIVNVISCSKLYNKASYESETAAPKGPSPNNEAVPRRKRCTLCYPLGPIT